MARVTLTIDGPFGREEYTRSYRLGGIALPLVEVTAIAWRAHREDVVQLFARARDLLVLFNKLTTPGEVQSDDA